MTSPAAEMPPIPDDMYLTPDGQMVEVYPDQRWRHLPGPVNVRLECDNGTLLLTMRLAGLNPISGRLMWVPDTRPWIPMSRTVQIAWDELPPWAELHVPYSAGMGGEHGPGCWYEQVHWLVALRRAGRWKDK